MTRQGRILVVDDEQRWRNALGNTLDKGGFHVETVSTTGEALTRLDEIFFHLLVLDIRMEHTDQNNVEGMNLLQALDERGLSPATRVIMLSAYGTKEQMRTAFRNHKVADFLTKEEFDNREFLAQVRELFSTEMKINLDLPIHWQEVPGPESVIDNLWVQNTRVKPNTPLHSRVVQELDDLLCRLSHKAESILIRPLTPGRSGAGVLLVQPFMSSGGGQSVVVKFGDFRNTDKELSNFGEYVQPFIGGGRSTTVRSYGRTALLGGIEYSLVGLVGERLRDFSEFYHDASISEIKASLNQLFFDTCAAWYASPKKLQPVDLTAEYQSLLNVNVENLDRALSERLKSVQGSEKLHFTALPTERSFVNPLPRAFSHHLARPTYRSITHGDFNGNNILVDTTGQTWLIDFLRTGPGHILRDVAELDTVLRIQMLSDEEVSLEERLRMEETLLNCTRFSQVAHLETQLPTENPSLAKAFAISVHLRTIAHRIVDQNPTDAMDEYYIALLYYALNMIRFYSLPTIQREHALLSACLVAEHLDL